MLAMTLDEALNFEWKEVAEPVRKPHEVVIGVKAAAVNRADLLQKDGCYASPPDWPQWCGLEVAGHVLEAPENSRFRVGDRVCALVGGGGYAEKIAVPEDMVIPLPEEISMVQGASIPEVWCTAYLNLLLEAGLQPGEVIFIQAGASGVGLAAIQLAKKMGAKVITTVGSQAKAEFVKSLGADIVLNHRTDDILQVIKVSQPNVALDCVGGRLMGQCLEYMAFGGRWIMIASLAGGDTTVNLETVWRKRLRLIGSTLRSRTSAEKGRIMSAIEQYLPLFAAGKLVTHIHAVFPMQEVETAHAILRRAENIGKVVLTLE
ncbi:MAG: NAD(P)H-quinone oxidoreductase [Victivallales bacterium]|nr:NAD(P)H-quinone oxidoreductase [Victivallales bacterium]